MDYPSDGGGGIGECDGVRTENDASVVLELREWRSSFLVLQGSVVGLFRRLDPWLVNHQGDLPEELEQAILELAIVAQHAPRALRQFLRPVDQAEQFVLAAAMALAEAEKPSGLVARFADLQEIQRAKEALREACFALRDTQKKTKLEMRAVLEKGNSPHKGDFGGKKGVKDKGCNDLQTP